MVIDQRNAGASVSLAGSIYTVDRWEGLENGSMAFTAQQSSTVPSGAGFTNSILITTTTAASPGSTDRSQFEQYIEGYNIADLGWGAAGAKTVTLSFWVRSSLTGQFGGALANGAGNRSYPYSYTISAANTWEYKTITVPGDTSGTWVTTNGRALCVYFDLGMGSSLLGTAGAWAGSDFRGATGDVKLSENNGATFYLTGVQLEVGSTATSFDYRPYGTELQLCQRYFWQLGGLNTGNVGALFPQPGNPPSSNGGMPLVFANPVPMRVAPDVSFNITAGNNSGGSTPSGTQWQLIAPAIDACTFSGSTVGIFGINSLTYSGVTMLYAGISRQPTLIVFGTTAWIKFSAEL
jgi:hypothetical protein